MLDDSVVDDLIADTTAIVRAMEVFVAKWTSRPDLVDNPSPEQIKRVAAACDELEAAFGKLRE